MTLNDPEQYIATEIHTWVWSGFHTAEEVNAMIFDLMEDEVDESKMRDIVEQEFANKAAQEADWPAITDCDRLDLAFDALNAKMIVAIQNAGYTMSDGLDDVGEIHRKMPHGTYGGYCFYHGQDLARAVGNGGLMLAFGDMKDTDEGKAVIANVILETLKDHGLETEWTGKVSTRISLPTIQWQRRLSRRKGR